MNERETLSPPERIALTKLSGHPILAHQETLLQDEHAIAKRICAENRGGQPCEDVSLSLATMCQTCVAQFRANFKARN